MVKIVVSQVEAVGKGDLGEDQGRLEANVQSDQGINQDKGSLEPAQQRVAHLIREEENDVSDHLVDYLAKGVAICS